MISQGCVLITVNTVEVGNDSPGLWNHCAIVSPRLTVIEAQEEPGRVIEVQLKNFLERYPEYVVYSPRIRQTLDCSLGVAFHAEQVIGERYIRYDSYFNWFNGFNCVSLVDYAYRNAIDRKRKFGWKCPDDVVKFANRNWLFVEQVRKYDTWVRPSSWFEGRIR